jgi:hypothetical protein
MFPSKVSHGIPAFICRAYGDSGSSSIRKRLILTIDSTVRRIRLSLNEPFHKLGAEKRLRSALWPPAAAFRRGVNP